VTTADEKSADARLENKSTTSTTTQVTAMPDQTARERLEVELEKCERHLVTYRDHLDRAYGTPGDIDAIHIYNAIDEMQRYRTTVKQALDDYNY